MKVLFFSNMYPSRLEQTRGIFHAQLVQALSKLCEVRVVAPRSWWQRLRFPSTLFRVRREMRDGVEVSYPTYWSIPRLSDLHGDAMVRSLRRYMLRLRTEFKFDVIVAAWAYPDAYAMTRLSHEIGCPIITKLLGSDINELTKYPKIRQKIVWTLDKFVRRLHCQRRIKAARGRTWS